MMTPRERFLAAVAGKKYDRVPLDILTFNKLVAPTVEGQASLPSGGPDKFQGRDPFREELFARLADKAIVHYPVCSGVLRYLCIPPQCIDESLHVSNDAEDQYLRKISTPKGDLKAIVAKRIETVETLWTLQYPVQSLEDVEKIRSIPWEVPIDAQKWDPKSVPPDEVGNRVVYSYVSSPAVCVGGMMKYENFLIWSFKHHEMIVELVELCTQRILDTLDVLLPKGGIDLVWIGGSEWLTPPMGSPALYEELVQEPERRIIAKIHEHGAYAHVHCHGNVRGCLEQVIERGGDIFEPVEAPPDGDISFKEAKEMAAGRMCLMGNVELHAMETAGRQELEEYTRRAFEGGKERMVLGISAHSTFPMLSQEARDNFHHFIDLWEELSVLD